MVENHKHICLFLAKGSGGKGNLGKPRTKPRCDFICAHNSTEENPSTTEKMGRLRTILH